MAVVDITLQEEIILSGKQSLDMVLDFHLNSIEPTDFLMTSLDGDVVTLNILDLAFLSIENILQFAIC